MYSPVSTSVSTDGNTITSVFSRTEGDSIYTKTMVLNTVTPSVSWTSNTSNSLSVLGTISELPDTATETDLVAGNYLALNGADGTKRLPVDAVAKSVDVRNSMRFDPDATERIVSITKASTSGNVIFDFDDLEFIRKGDKVVVNYDYTLSHIYIGVYYEGDSTETVVKEATSRGAYTFVAGNNITRVRTYAQGVATGVDIISSVDITPLVLVNSYRHSDDLFSSVDKEIFESGLRQFEFFQNKQATGSSVQLITNGVRIPKGYRLDFTTTGSFGSCFLAVTYPTGEVTSVAEWGPGTSVHSYTLTEDCLGFRLYLSETIVGSTYSMSVTAEAKLSVKRLDDLQSQIDELNGKQQTRGLTFGIIGDSYSTYANWIVSGNDTWYAVDGVDGANTQTNDVNAVADCWWYRLSKDLGMSLVINDSYSGSTICNTGYGGIWSGATSFVTRQAASFGKDATIAGKIKPDVIFVFGGTNDSWANSPIGEIKYEGRTYNDLNNVLPAICSLFENIKKWQPQAIVINVVNTGLKSDIVNGFRTITEHYGVFNLELSDISKQSNHPDKNGMASINSQVKAKLLDIIRNI